MEEEETSFHILTKCPAINAVKIFLLGRASFATRRFIPCLTGNSFTVRKVLK